MIPSLLRRYLAVFFVACAAATAVHAQVYTGSGTINLNSVPKSNFQIVTYLSIYNGSNYYTSVDIYLGNFSAHSHTDAGAADAFIYYNNVHKLSNGTWVAGNVTIYTLDPYWSWTTQVFYNVALPSSLSFGGIGYWGDAASYQPYTIIN